MKRRFGDAAALASFGIDPRKISKATRRTRNSLHVFTLAGRSTPPWRGLGRLVIESGEWFFEF